MLGLPCYPFSALILWLNFCLATHHVQHGGEDQGIDNLQGIIAGLIWEGNARLGVHVGICIVSGTWDQSLRACFCFSKWLYTLFCRVNLQYVACGESRAWLQAESTWCPEGICRCFSVSICSRSCGFIAQTTFLRIDAGSCSFKELSRIVSFVCCFFNFIFSVFILFFIF